jgi:DNA-binding XRE family transcriptional regulator
MMIPGKLREYRLKAFLTAAELAESAGLSERTVKDLEAGGDRAVYPPTVRKLALALGREPGDLATVVVGEEVAS